MKKRKVESCYNKISSSNPHHNLPPKEEFLKDIEKSSPLDWDIMGTFTISSNQTQDSFNEQKLLYVTLLMA